MGAEKRRFPRYNEQIAVHLKRAQFDFKLMTDNVSREGIGVITGDPRALPRSQQEIVSLSVSVPDQGPALRVIGQVAWSKQAETGIELGVRFYLIAREEKERWDKWIDEIGERDRARVAHDARQKAESARAKPLEVRERSHGQDVPIAPAALEPPSAVEQPKPWVIAVDPAFDRSRRRFPRQRMLFLVRHHSQEALRSYVAGELLRGPVSLNAPQGQFQKGEMVNLVLVHPATQVEFELLARVVEQDPSGRIGVAAEVDATQRAELEQFVKTGKIPELG